MMLTFFTWVTSLMLIPYVTFGGVFAVLTNRKIRVYKKVGMKRLRFVDEQFPAILCAIPVVVFGFLFGYLNVGEEGSALWILTSIITFLLFCVFVVLTLALLWELGKNWKDFKAVLADVKDVNRFSDYFGEMEAGNRIRFKKLFKFNPLENERDEIEYQLNKNRDEKALIEIAKAYHQLIGLEELASALPDEGLLKEEDKQAIDVLRQQINELTQALKESSETVRSMVIKNENIHFSDEQLKALEKVRSMSVQPTPEKTFIHPTLEALIQVQTMPGVSADRVQEAKRLEAEVKQLLKQKKTPWNPNELADTNINAVKLHHGIQ